MIVSATLCITSNRKFDRVALFIFAAIGVPLFKVLKYLLQSGNKMQYTIFNNLGLTMVPVGRLRKRTVGQAIR